MGAALVWMAAYCMLRSPMPQSPSPMELVYVWDGYDDAGLDACCWAALAYVLTFTPTLLFLHGRLPHSAFGNRSGAE